VIVPISPVIDMTAVSTPYSPLGTNGNAHNTKMDVVGYKTFDQLSTFGVKDAKNASPAILREKKK
jgi:hypothetical protein